MSSIEQLKAEARALREAEKQRGKILAHSETLEQVARKHGYASWRAAVAVLGGIPPEATSPPPSPASMTNPSGFVPSTLQGDEAEAARERAFTRWMSRAERQAAVDFSKKMGLLPVYAETSAEGTRYLFWRMPRGAACEVRSGRTKEQFQAFASSNTAKGRTLVSLHVSSEPAYSAVWISAEHHGQAVEHLRRFGIGAAVQA